MNQKPSEDLTCSACSRRFRRLAFTTQTTTMTMVMMTTRIAPPMISQKYRSENITK